MKKGTDGWIDLAVIMSFNKMKALSTDKDVVIAAIKDSEIVELVS